MEKASIRIFSRVFFIILFIIIGLYHFLSPYYNLNPYLLQLSPNGLKALIHYELGQYEKASKAWRAHYRLSYDMSSVDHVKKSLLEQIEKEPDKIENYLLLADIYFSMEDYPNATATYQRILQRNMNVYDARIGLASSLLGQGKFQKSQAAFEDLFNQLYYDAKYTISFLNFLIALDKLKNSDIPDKGEKYLTLAYAYRYLGIIDRRKNKQVIAYSDKVISANKNLDRAFFTKGIIYAKEKKYDKALEQLTKAVGANPLYAEAFNRMAYIYGQMGNLEKELECFKKAVKIEENNPTYAFNLGRTLLGKYGDIQQAHFYLLKAYELNPDNYDYASKYADALVVLKRFDDAIDVYDNIIKREPENLDGYTSKALCFIRMKKFEDAVHLFLKAKEMYPLDFNAARNLAYAYSELKKFEYAISVDEYALQIKPHDVDTLFDLQNLYRRQGRYEEAYRAVTEILRIQPDHSGAQRVLPYIQRNVTTRRSQ